MGDAIPPIQQEKGRGAIGYLMPVYTVGIIVLFVYTAMKLMFKKNAEEEEGEEEERRRALRLTRSRTRGPVVGVAGASSGASSRVEPKYDEEYYNNLISQQQQAGPKQPSTGPQPG